MPAGVCYDDEDKGEDDHANSRSMDHLEAIISPLLPSLFSFIPPFPESDERESNGEALNEEHKAGRL